MTLQPSSVKRFSYPFWVLAPMGWIQRLVRDPSYVVLPVIVLLCCLGLWEIFSLIQGKGGLPGPLKVLGDTKHLILNPWYIKNVNDKGLGWHILASLEKVAVGYLLAAFVGIATGIAIGVSTLLYRGFDPIFQVLRTVPPLAWLPIAQLALQDPYRSSVFIIFITAIWPIVINTAVGVQEVPQDYRNVARVLQLSKLEYFWKVLLPSSAPYIFTGLRIAVGLSWLAIVAAEMISSGDGIGSFIMFSYNAGSEKVSEIIISIIYIGLVGLILDKLVFYIGKLVVQSEN